MCLQHDPSVPIKQLIFITNKVTILDHVLSLIVCVLFGTESLCIMVEDVGLIVIIQRRTLSQTECRIVNQYHLFPQLHMYRFHLLYHQVYTQCTI